MSYDDFDQVRGDVDGFFSIAFSSVGRSLFDTKSTSLRPLSRVDVQNEYVTVTFDLPGVSRDDISVTCTEVMVSLEAQVSKSFRTNNPRWFEETVEYVSYSERVQLPVIVDPDRGTARFKNGIIVVKLPRSDRGKPVKISEEGRSRSRK
jgi:HSP20 family protein